MVPYLSKNLLIPLKHQQSEVRKANQRTEIQQSAEGSEMRKDDTARYDSLFFVQEDWETSYQIQFDKDYTSSFLASLPQGRQLTIFSAGWKPSQQMVLGCVCQPQRICLACLHVTLFLSKQQAINAECFPVLSNRGWGGRRNPWEEIQKWFSFIMIL